MPRIEFFYDYGSPFSYLANSVAPGVASEHGAELVYRPMLLGGLLTATGNQSRAF
jgi:2-hydroxychromene-2-carboxylate isomerase